MLLGWGVATFRDQNTDIIVIISLSLAFYQFSSTLIYVLLSLLRLLHACWWWLHGALRLSGLTIQFQQINFCTQPHLCLLGKPTNKAKCSIFTARTEDQYYRCYFSLLAAHPVPAVLHWLAMWGNVATTAGHLPATARTDCCLPGALSWSHGYNLGLKFLCNRQSHIWPLQWMSAVAGSSLLQHWSA